MPQVVRLAHIVGSGAIAAFAHGRIEMVIIRAMILAFAVASGASALLNVIEN